MTLDKIICGGQTGADRGALGAALASDFPCVASRAIGTFNVAGPRESGHAGARTYAEQGVGCLLKEMR